MKIAKQPGFAGRIVRYALVLLAGAFAMLGLGKVIKVSPPKRTIRTVKDDIEWAKHPTTAPAPQEAELEELRASHRG